MSGNILTRSTACRFQHPQRQRPSPWMKYFPNPLNLFYRNQQKSPPNQNADARSPISNKHPAAFASRKAAFVFNRDICPLTLNPLNRRIKKQLNGLQGRDSKRSDDFSRPKLRIERRRCKSGNRRNQTNLSGKRTPHPHKALESLNRPRHRRCKVIWSNSLLVYWSASHCD